MVSPEEEVFARIGELDLEQLMTVHGELKLPNIEKGKKVKSYVMKVILKYLSIDTLEQTEDGGQSTFLWIMTLFDGEDVKTEDTTRKGDEIVAKIERRLSPTSDILSLKKVLKNDFKIRGTIGLPGQKDKLTFSSLAYQMNNGEKKMYTDVEICEEVIRAISPDLTLGYFLEGKNDLTLQKLRKILRAHFQEKDPTTLFNSLSNQCQQNNESPLLLV